MDGDHSLEECRAATGEVLRTVFNQLNSQRVLLEGMILKPNMVLPGLTCPQHQEVKEVGVGEQQYQVRLTDRQPDEEQDIDEVANVTVKSLWRTVPAAVPGIAFLSGGQSAELASERLNAMNLRFKSQLPWALSFSFARAIQQPALEIWRGEEANVKVAQKALLHRARCNRSARRGEYTAAMEKITQ
jgi:fructose-bisphosphate aldolase class I